MWIWFIHVPHACSWIILMLVVLPRIRSAYSDVTWMEGFWLTHRIWFRSSLPAFKGNERYESSDGAWTQRREIGFQETWCALYTRAHRRLRLVCSGRLRHLNRKSLLSYKNIVALVSDMIANTQPCYSGMYSSYLSLIFLITPIAIFTVPKT